MSHGHDISIGVNTMVGLETVYCVQSAESCKLLFQ